MCELIYCSYPNLYVHEELVTQAFVQGLLPVRFRVRIMPHAPLPQCPQGSRMLPLLFDWPCLYQTSKVWRMMMGIVQCHYSRGLTLQSLPVSHKRCWIDRRKTYAPAATNVVNSGTLQPMSLVSLLEHRMTVHLPLRRLT